MTKQPQKNVPLAEHTTYRVGGAARYFWSVSDQAELLAALEWAQAHEQKIFLLGGGSNVLFTDAGFPGLVICLHSGTWQLADQKIQVFAGASLSALVQFYAAKNLTGLAGCVGIPGTVGGALRGNAGTPDGSIGDLVLSVTVWVDGQVKKITRSKCKFAYRDSRFKRNTEIILSAELLAVPGEGSVFKQTRKLLDARLGKQPRGFSCGSFFQNPAGDSAGRLIEACGLKGLAVGGAQISDQHANWIINTGTATAEDILALGRQVQKAVQDKFGITLEPEVELVGCSLVD